ncbi:hypothetical protein [Salinisphaera aquimarina]|uniref:Uncharacterized protein n=1 Tax=Salinisphaera aquimarina TaxID=2094031 RepID=A0ABV7ERR5_9GAMM
MHGTLPPLNAVPRQTIALAPSKSAACGKDTAKHRASRLARLYLDTPAPDHAPVTERAIPEEPRPEPPVSSVHPFRWLSPRAWRIRRARERAQRDSYNKALAQWRAERRAHAAVENCLSAAITVAARGDVFAMEYALEVALTAIDWPGRADVDCDIVDPSTLLMDVTLSSDALTDYPPAKAPAALRLVKGSNNQSEDFADRSGHVASAAFRLLGEAFHHLPTLETVEMTICARPGRQATPIRPPPPAPMALQIGRTHFAGLYDANLGGIKD